jgi:hypothetical protein
MTRSGRMTIPSKDCLSSWASLLCPNQDGLDDAAPHLSRAGFPARDSIAVRRV